MVKKLLVTSGASYPDVFARRKDTKSTLTTLLSRRGKAYSERESNSVLELHNNGEVCEYFQKGSFQYVCAHESSEGVNDILEGISSHANNPEGVDYFTRYHDVKIVQYIMKKKDAPFVRYLIEECEAYNVGIVDGVFAPPKGSNTPSPKKQYA